MKKIDYKAIAEYQQGKITQEDAASKLMVTEDYLDEFIMNLSDEGINDVEHARREELRRFGSAFVSMQEDLSRMECPINSKWMGRV